MRTAMETWARFVDNLVTPPEESNVVSMVARAER
jgi:hypothetical protein